MSQIYQLSAVEILNQIKLKKLAISEVAHAFIERIQQVNPFINAIHQCDPQRILQEALEAERLFTLGQILPFHGLPISIKDTFHVKGFRASKGSPSLYKNTSAHDATVVARLKAEGAIIFGLTNVPELLLSYETDNLVYGRSNNPYDFNRTPGGSSGGQAAIIAAGGTPVGIGSDAGGSIRQPAHYCGICGHKPTNNIVPFTGLFPSHNLGMGAQLLAIGPMARYVEDLILLMSIISGASFLDPHTVPYSLTQPELIDISSLKIGYFFNNPTGAEPDNDTVRAISNVVQFLKSEKCDLTENYPSCLDKVYRLHLETFIFGGNGGESVRLLLEELGQVKISQLTQNFLSYASQCNFSINELRQRWIEVEQFRFDMMEFMYPYDVLLSPVTATAARFHGETWDSIRDVGYVIAHNLTGWPATVVPCGYNKDGLPIGIQIVAKPWHDHIALALALKIQQIVGVFPIPLM